MTFFKIIINYIIGFLTVEIEGFYIERVINECIHKGILIWKINRIRSVVINASVGANDIEKIKNIAEKNQCKIRVIKKKGLPFFISNHKNRRYIIIMAILLLIGIVILSKSIWNIEIISEEGINNEEIKQILYEEGLNVGKLKTSIDTEKIINKIRIDRKDISWVGIDIKGTNAIIRIVKAKEKPEIIDETNYCNIVAKKDGVITKITAQNGTSVVEEGTEVKKGDLLIAGWMEGKYTDKNYVNANGEVKAKVLYSQNEKVDKKEIKREQTGEKNKKMAIKINNFRINFYKTLSKFEIYDTIETIKKLRISSNFYLPIDIIQYTNYEIKEIEINHSYEEAKELGKATAEAKLNELITEGNIVNKITDVTEYPNYYSIVVKYEVIEDIGTKEKIDF